MADPTQLAPIDPAALATVTGGASSGSSDFMQMLPMMMMMMNRGSSAPVESAQPMPPDGDPNGWTRVA